MNKELHLTKKDFKIEWFSGSGAGGQHRNKHQNCCRIIHIETGLRAQCVDNRDRISNQDTAFRRLSKLILSHYYPDTSPDRFKTDEVIRNYHEPRNEVLDKSSGKKVSYKAVINDGCPDEIIEARRKFMADKDLITL